MKHETIKKGSRLQRVAVYLTAEGLHHGIEEVVVGDAVSKKDKHVREVTWRNHLGTEGVASVDVRDVGRPSAKLLNLDGARSGLLMVVSACVPCSAPVDVTLATCRAEALKRAEFMSDLWAKALAAAKKGQRCATS